MAADTPIDTYLTKLDDPNSGLYSHYMDNLSSC